MSFNYQNSNSKGFTLLEVLISMAILVMISYSIYQATTQTYKLRDTLLTEGNFYNNIRLAATIIQKDFSTLYSPTVSLPRKIVNPLNSLKKDQEKILNLPGNLSRPYEFWAAALNENGLRPSRFYGTEQKMSFISVSNLRIYKDSPESEFVKITYELAEDKNTKFSSKSSSTKVLVKKSDTNAFQMEESSQNPPKTYPLLPGVQTFKITYYQKEGYTYKKLKDWDSVVGDTVNLYPDMIEIYLEVLGPKNQKFEGFYKIRPEIPLNGLLGSI